MALTKEFPAGGLGITEVSAFWQLKGSGQLQTVWYLTETHLAASSEAGSWTRVDCKVS